MADELPEILVLSRVIVANPPLCGATLIRTLIADGNPPLSASHHPSHRGPVSVPECDPLLFAVTQLSLRNGPFSVTDAIPMISTKFRAILGNLPLFAADLFGTLIAASNSPIFATILGAASMTCLFRHFSNSPLQLDTANFGAYGHILRKINYPLFS